MNDRASERGLVLAALLFFITGIAVMLALLIPSYFMDSKREMEAETIFRGSEYARAIRKYQNKNGGLPVATELLLKDSAAIPSLRRAYVDPTSGEEFRPIYLNTDGTLAGSRLYPTLRAARTSTAQTLGEIAAAMADTVDPNTAAGGGAAGASPAGNAASNNQTLVQQLGMVGVGSNTDKTAVKIFVGQDRYLNWEFIAEIRDGAVPSPANEGGANPSGAAPSGNTGGGNINNNSGANLNAGGRG